MSLIAPALLDRFPDFGSPAQPDQVICLADLPRAAVCGRAISQELRVRDDLDTRGCGAALLARLGISLGATIAALDLAGRGVGHVGPADVSYEAQVVQTANGPELSPRFYFPACPDATSPHPAEVSIVAARLMTPLVFALSQNCKLQAILMWQMLSRAIVAAYDELGVELGQQAAATRRAQDILNIAPSPFIAFNGAAKPMDLCNGCAPQDYIATAIAAYRAVRKARAQ